jgi:hypothetical protein
MTFATTGTTSIFAPSKKIRREARCNCSLRFVRLDRQKPLELPQKPEKTRGEPDLRLSQFG